MQFTKGNGKVTVLSLEELLVSVKSCRLAAITRSNERKKARKSSASSSSHSNSHSDPRRCHVGLNSQFTKLVFVISLACLIKMQVYTIQIRKKGKMYHK